MWPMLGFLPPLECQRHDTGPSRGPQENVIDSAGNLPTENQPLGGSAILAEVGSQMSGGARQPRFHPNTRIPLF